MTILRAVTVFGRLLLLVVLVGSGIYVLLYLWRWEWERAQIAGVFFLAALIVLSTQLVLRRIAEISAARPVNATQAPTASPVAPPRPFAWTEPDQSTYIFLPVLLGFGVALSALAAVAERLVAFAVGAPGANRSDRPGHTVPQGLLAAGLVAVLLVTGVLIAVARNRLMTQPETPMPGTRTYVLDVDSRQLELDVEGSITTLAQYCRDRAHVEWLTIEEVRTTSDDTGVLVVEPVLGRLGTARFEGCLVDAVLDRRTVELVEVRTEVTEAVPPSGS